ncbi:hypothetical protein HY29_00355 [Hyphomonas beringensis]|uniref:Uncharacterized protein n=1 Tax=Hyphomonas beringensis TaxID=1280946 RepID=A0A062UKX7_9PROT|nr:hypothetical protein HY29_00355 [Hyphomonas beringensis]
MHQCDLGGVGRAGKHTLPKERAADRDAIKAANKIFAVPALDGVGVPLTMQGAVQVQDWGVDPCALASCRALGAHFHDARKGLVSGDSERILLHGPGKPLWHMKALERDDPAHVRINQEKVRIIASISHREDATPVAG